MNGGMIHAGPIKELMHSCEAVLHMIIYINGLKCTLFTLFYFKLCRTVELSYDDSNLIANR